MERAKKRRASGKPEARESKTVGAPGVTPVRPLRFYQQHEWTGHGGGHGLMIGGGHGLQTGGGHGLQHGGTTGMQTGIFTQQFVGFTGAHGTQHAEASDTLASIAPAAINASNVLMINPFFFPCFSTFV
jgi:hypothetical protein